MSFQKRENTRQILDNDFMTLRRPVQRKSPGLVLLATVSFFALGLVSVPVSFDHNGLTLAKAFADSGEKGGDRDGDGRSGKDRGDSDRGGRDRDSGSGRSGGGSSSGGDRSGGSSDRDSGRDRDSGSERDHDSDNDREGDRDDERDDDNDNDRGDNDRDDGDNDNRARSSGSSGGTSKSDRELCSVFGEAFCQ